MCIRDRAYRYVVDRVRAKGAANILWVWHPNNSSNPDEPWNATVSYTHLDVYKRQGATSAFKKSAIAKAGGIVADTLAEDTDLTFHLHRAGYQIRYTPQAVAYTEAPDLSLIHI